MERKMDINTNLSNSNTKIDAGIPPPAIDCHQEIISQLPNPAVMPHVTAIASYCWVESIMKKESHSDSLACWRSFANEQ